MGFQHIAMPTMLNWKGVHWGVMSFLAPSSEVGGTQYENEPILGKTHLCVQSRHQIRIRIRDGFYQKFLLD